MGVKIHGVETVELYNERHYRGDICWCAPEYDAACNTYIHNSDFEKGCNVKYVKGARA